MNREERGPCCLECIICVGVVLLVLAIGALSCTLDDPSPRSSEPPGSDVACTRRWDLMSGVGAAVTMIVSALLYLRSACCSRETNLV